MVELVLDQEDTDCGACGRSDDHWVGDWPPLYEVVVNVEPFMNCGEQERSCVSELASLRALAYLEERRGLDSA